MAEDKKISMSGPNHGISLVTAVGAAVAVQISWSINHSVGWAIWHGLLNWFYVIYRLFVGTG
jgi:hypothetical protein